MKRDLSNITRDLEDKKNNDIIRKKNIIEKMFNEDPDLNEILGKREELPLNKYEHSVPTEQEFEERQKIIEYNKSTEHKQIIPFLKLNGINKEVLNFIMFDIQDTEVSYTNSAIKKQILVVMCLVHEDDMFTEYNIVRTDLLGYIVKDLLCWSNSLGMQLKCISDFPDIIDSRYYCRTIKFEIEAPNHLYAGMSNRYDRFNKI